MPFLVFTCLVLPRAVKPGAAHTPCRWGRSQAGCGRLPKARQQQAAEEESPRATCFLSHILSIWGADLRVAALWTRAWRALGRSRRCTDAACRGEGAVGHPSVFSNGELCAVRKPCHRPERGFWRCVRITSSLGGPHAQKVLSIMVNSEHDCKAGGVHL